MTARELQAKIMKAAELRYGIEFEHIVIVAARLLVNLHEHDLNECDPEVACSSNLTFSDELSELIADIDNATCDFVRSEES